MKDPSLKAGVIKDLVLLACVGVKPVLVHGGGPEINTWLEKVGIEPNFKNGLRVTGALLQPPSSPCFRFRTVLVLALFVLPGVVRTCA